jgi:hypothetical protein
MIRLHDLKNNKNLEVKGVNYEYVKQCRHAEVVYFTVQNGYYPIILILNRKVQ